MITGKHKDQQLKIKVEGGPGRRLMLGYGGDNWNIILGVRGIQQRVESASPGSNFAGDGENQRNKAKDTAQNHRHGLDEDVKVFAGHLRPEIVDKRVQLADSKHAKRLQVEKKIGEILMLTEKARWRISKNAQIKIDQ